MTWVVYFLISRRFGDRDAPRRPLSTLTEDDADLRGRFKDTVFVDKVDLRNKLRDATAPEGIDLYVLARSFVGSTIQPLFSEADVVQSGFGQILSGVFSGGVFGSSKPSQVSTVASPPRPRQPSTPSELPRSSTTPKTALQGSVRSRDPKSKKPAARPLAKRAYAYVDRLRGASKYLDADDNARLPRAVRVLDTLFTSANGRARPHHDARVRRILPVIVPREHDDERSPTTLVRVDYSFIGGGKTAKPGNGANGESKDSGVWGIWL